MKNQIKIDKMKKLEVPSRWKTMILNKDDVE